MYFDFVKHKFNLKSMFFIRFMNMHIISSILDRQYKLYSIHALEWKEKSSCGNWKQEEINILRSFALMLPRVERKKGPKGMIISTFDSSGNYFLHLLIHLLTIKCQKMNKNGGKISRFVRPTVQNPMIFSLLSCMRKKNSKQSWNQRLFVSKRLIDYQSSCQLIISWSTSMRRSDRQMLIIL